MSLGDRARAQVCGALLAQGANRAARIIVLSLISTSFRDSPFARNRAGLRFRWGQPPASSVCGYRSTIERLLTELAKAAEEGAPEIGARRSDGSFLESTLERAIARHLPGVVSTSQQRRRFPLPGYDPAPYGVDIEWMPDGTRNGIEVKVTDVLDSLFDVVKLATAAAHGLLTLGFCAIAATESQWSSGGPITAMVEAGRGVLSEWQVTELLVGAGRDAVLVATGPRPTVVPARLRTMAGPRIVLPRARPHVLRLLAVSATAAELVPVE